MNVENFQPENNYTCHKILLDLGDDSPPKELLTRPEPFEIQEYPITPYMLVRATAFQWIEPIREVLGEQGIKIAEEVQIPQFETLLRHLYPVNPTNENSYMWLYLSRAFLGEEMANRGYAFILDKEHLNDYEKVTLAKRHVRKHIGLTPFRLRYQGRIIDTDLHHIHAPDEKDIKYEYSLLKSYLNVISKHEG